ncbi:hypothetical protein [Clostridium tertium]|uniref:hypothetical protein n=1 Tax=Clostridium tertium TaxID=1559 RepID=UPI0024B3470C|nr:hypothetical protein [Clostridium tertium]MDI9219269.1 hypothetical protein [Clostridium tertium]
MYDSYDSDEFLFVNQITFLIENKDYETLLKLNLDKHEKEKKRKYTNTHQTK